MKKLVKDLVCGMEVDEATAQHKTEYMGKTYYFCSPECKAEFEKNSARYVGSGHRGCC